MGLQMLANCNKRNREDCLMDEDNLIPTKLCKTGGADIWEEEYYHPSGKCYQCNSTDSINGGAIVGSAGNGIFYSGSHNNEQYNSHCWSVPPPINAVTVSAPSLSTTSSSSSCCSSPNATTNGTTIVTVGPNFGSQQTVNNCGMHMMGSYLHSTSSMAGAQSQQTIRCDENGKSYLDLGSGSSIVAYSSGSSSSGGNGSGSSSSSNSSSSSSSSSNSSSSSSSSSNSSNSVSSSRYNNFVNGGQKTSSGGAVGDRCCSSWRTKWCMCGPACYRQRRMAVLNISMCKLGRYRQFTDPSLYRSVLICNTLRYIEREMEQEGCFNSSNGAAPPNHSSAATNCATAAASQQSVGGSTSSTSAFPSQSPLMMFEPPPEPPRVPTPYPQTFPLEDNDSGLGDENKSINWGSVLSLSSQSDLDPLNNNDSLADLDFSQDLDDIVPSCKLTPLSVEDILKTMPTSPPPSITTSPSCSTKCSDSSSSSAELDTIMHVLKFS